LIILIRASSSITDQFEHEFGKKQQVSDSSIFFVTRESLVCTLAWEALDIPRVLISVTPTLIGIAKTWRLMAYRIKNIAL
jgi:hypothetical protein